MHTPLRIDAEGKSLLIDGDADGDAVMYPHDLHSDLLGGENSCGLCHHLENVREKTSPCMTCHARMQEHKPVFSHDRHIDEVSGQLPAGGAPPENRTCVLCHDAGRRRGEVAPGLCTRCHAGTGWVRVQEMTDMRGYVDALHSNCVRCHYEKVPGTKERKLSDCRTCHR